MCAVVHQSTDTMHMLCKFESNSNFIRVYKKYGDKKNVYVCIYKFKIYTVFKCNVNGLYLSNNDAKLNFISALLSRTALAFADIFNHISHTKKKRDEHTLVVYMYSNAYSHI